MDLSTWKPEDYQVSAFRLFLLHIGGRPFRCEYCRRNFVSFRWRRERFSFRRWGKRAQAPEPVAGTEGRINPEIEPQRAEDKASEEPPATHETGISSIRGAHGQPLKDNDA